LILNRPIAFITKLAVSLVILIASLFTNAEAQNLYNPKTQRILIILDASSSMNAKWQKQSRFELAKTILVSLTDSIYKTNKNIEFGLRVLGHQYHKDLNNCTDSKLEVPFGKNNSPQIKAVLDKISPKGQTPLAYSLFQAAVDFPKDSMAGHSIIIITDGIETCKGNACDAAKQLAEKRISVRPYIVGLGISDTMLNFYKCVGTVVNAKEESELGNIINAAVKQALNKTTTQINLLNSNGEPLETNVAFTLYDHTTHKERYQYVHRLDPKNNPDTIVIDPKGLYDIVVHSIPEVRKENIELSAGKHNIIAMDVPQGILSLEYEGQKLSTLNAVQCIIRRADSPHILYVQDVGSQNNYLVGKYDLEVLTLPRIYVSNIIINQSKTTVQKISVPGYLQINTSETGVASVFMRQNEKMILVHDFHAITSNQNIALQPGNYILMYRPDKGKKASRTKSFSVKIEAAKTTAVNFR
jgi:Ca-activated chloride channel family protein